MTHRFAPPFRSVGEPQRLQRKEGRYVPFEMITFLWHAWLYVLSPVYMIWMGYNAIKTLRGERKLGRLLKVVYWFSAVVYIPLGLALLAVASYLLVG